MSGYVDNPAANQASFVEGWFRTGDQGRFDEDGYLTITGRLKEVINRGGEKVAPREIDIALLEHADVVEAAAFAIPHDRLGEDVAAAVVLRDGADVTTAQLRLFVGERLAPYKVPRRVVVVEALPRAERARSSVRTWPRPSGWTRRPQAGARPGSTSTRPMTSNGLVRSGSASWISTSRRAPIASSSTLATR